MTSIYKGIKIHYTSQGHGKAVVFLHGFLENSSMWSHIAAYFSNNHTCICVDLLGHGQTECLGYIHTMDDMAEAVKSVLDKLQISEAIFVGHSMGGYVALAVLEKFSGIVSGLILLNSTSYPDNKERKINRSRAINLVKQNPNAYTGMAISNLFAEKNRTKFKEEIIQIKEAAAKTPLQGIIAALEGMKIRKNHTRLLKEFKKPKIIIAGKKDPVLSYQQSEEESEVTKTKLICLEGGHMSYIENESELCSQLHDFLT